MEKNSLITARIPATLKAAAQKAAAADGRTFSGWLVKTIKEAVEAQQRTAAQRQHFQTQAPAAAPAPAKREAEK